MVTSDKSDTPETSALSAQRRDEIIKWFLEHGWERAQDGRDAMCKTFHFTTFAQAFGWMTKIAIIADKLNHHPQWSNMYNCVNVTLITHDTGGISELDFTLAKKMEQ